MAIIDVDFDIDRFKREARAFTRRQVPFASSLALNMTMWGSIHETRDELPRYFTIRRKGGPHSAPGGFRPGHKATKVEQWAEWGHRKEYMLRQAEGGTKQRGRAQLPELGRVAIPVRARRTERTPITKRTMPKAFAAQGAFEKNGALYMPLGSRSKGRGRRRLKLLYIFRPSISVPQRFPFDDITERAVARLWPENMTRAWAKALKSAR